MAGSRLNISYPKYRSALRPGCASDSKSRFCSSTISNSSSPIIVNSSSDTNSSLSEIAFSKDVSVLSNIAFSCATSFDVPKSGRPMSLFDSEDDWGEFVFPFFSFCMAASICWSEYPLAFAAALTCDSDMPVDLIIVFACFICASV